LFITHPSFKSRMNNAWKWKNGYVNQIRIKVNE
jgi:hypothetical protein